MLCSSYSLPSSLEGKAELKRLDIFAFYLLREESLGASREATASVWIQNSRRDHKSRK